MSSPHATHQSSSRRSRRESGATGLKPAAAGRLPRLVAVSSHVSVLAIEFVACKSIGASTLDVRSSQRSWRSLTATALEGMILKGRRECGAS
eukprot:3877840-Pleurochrysis_carterae.AAC.1